MKDTESKTKKSSFSMSFLYKAWLMSIALFYMLLVVTRRESFTGLNNGGGWWITWLLVITAFGALVYIAFTIKTLFSFKKKQAKLFLLANLVTFFSFFALLLNIESIEASLGLSPPSWSSTPKVRPTVVPASNGSINGHGSEEAHSIAPKQPVNTDSTNTTQGNNVECIGPDGKHFSTTMEECKNLNEKWGKPVDYMLDCNIHPDCGGGTVRMSKSQCASPCSGHSTADTNSQDLSPCNLSFGTFNLTHELCLHYTQMDLELTTQQMQDTVDQIYTYQPSTYDADSTTTVSNNNAELLDECRGIVQRTYQSESRRIKNTARANGMGGSYLERELDALKNNLERAVDECERQYPLN